MLHETIDTLDKLKALPIGTRVRDKDGDVATVIEDRERLKYDDRDFGFCRADYYLPATVISRPALRVGDRVRLVEPNNSSPKAGALATVTSGPFGSDPVMVNVNWDEPSAGYDSNFFASRFEAVVGEPEPKVKAGTPLRLVDPTGGARAGALFFAAGQLEDGFTGKKMVRVTPLEGDHRCEGMTVSTARWYFDRFEVLDKMPEVGVITSVPGFMVNGWLGLPVEVKDTTPRDNADVYASPLANRPHVMDGNERADFWWPKDRITFGTTILPSKTGTATAEAAADFAKMTANIKAAQREMRSINLFSQAKTFAMGVDLADVPPATYAILTGQPILAPKWKVGDKVEISADAIMLDGGPVQEHFLGKQGVVVSDNGHMVETHGPRVQVNGAEWPNYVSPHCLTAVAPEKVEEPVNNPAFIFTVEELEALPNESIVVAVGFSPLRKIHGRWIGFLSRQRSDDRTIWLVNELNAGIPLAVVHYGGDEYRR